MAEPTSLVESPLHGRIRVGSNRDLEALRSRLALVCIPEFGALLVHRQVLDVDRKYLSCSVGGLSQVEEVEVADTE